ncbi:hypothetical protein R6Q57_030046 [Mikania cordata]
MAKYHGGNGGNEDPWNSNRLRGGCESSQPKKRRTKEENLTLYKKYEQNNKRPLPIAVTTDEDQYRFVKDNSSDLIRLISNEEFFDLQALKNEGLWEEVNLGINAECVRNYKDRKQKAKMHFLANGGYENI